MKNKKPELTLTESIIILIGILALMAVGIIGLHISPEVPILFGIMVLIFWAKWRGFSWDHINESFIVGIKSGILPLFIFLLIGSLIGLWIATGIIPTLMVYGFHLINVNWFLPSVFVICGAMGAVIGSAFTVCSTLGIAFMGIGLTLGVDPAMTAGAILSGAVFGDKASPLSVSTNVAASVVHANLIDHIKNLMWSTIPASIVAFIMYTFLGRHTGHANFASVNQTISVLQHHFIISPVALIPVFLLFICAWIKIPTIPTLFINLLVSGIMGLLRMPGLNLIKINNVIQNGFVSQTGDKRVDMLLTRGGIAGMMGTVALIFVALSIGGLLINLGIIKAIMVPLTSHLRSTASLIISVIITCLGVNFFIGEQFLSLILPGESFAKAFKEHNLAPVALSRALEDGGTALTYLIPWGVAGSFVTATLGVPTIAYLPFVFLSLFSPVFSILSAVTGFQIKHIHTPEKTTTK
ncbi:Na+/H+ antiporter NhaC (plasmid) [Nicoliella spurrieriana]|uniref:Na+/H+ antiporter NhaC n=1 Tax=Nicoliella spurrieriana TaxID=2925830 RepID=A0A976RR17_9LACO|nr:Na+/H+ antiporter NhaC [Nicoliella spurrieriana]UQS86186.1 Na+/H+ antiporter NhaC [Nicoliella spurrieriana]